MTFDQILQITDETLDHFDADKIHRVMTSLNWKWPGKNLDVPTVAEIRAEARRHIKFAIAAALLNHDQWMISGSGGLLAESYLDHLTERLDVRMAFVLEESSNF